MDDNNGNIVYYLVLGAIYILSRVFGKKKKKPVNQQKGNRKIVPPTAEKETAEVPSLSFEDILRELSGTTQPKPVPVEEAEPVIDEPAYSMENTPAYDAIEPNTYDTDAIDEIAVDYHVPQTIGYDRYKKPTNVGSTREQDVFERDDSYTIKDEVTVNYLEGLYDLNGAAKAFVLSEIFQRKYQQGEWGK